MFVGNRALYRENSEREKDEEDPEPPPELAPAPLLLYASRRPTSETNGVQQLAVDLQRVETPHAVLRDDHLADGTTGALFQVPRVQTVHVEHVVAREDLHDVAVDELVQTDGTRVVEWHHQSKLLGTHRTRGAGEDVLEVVVGDSRSRGGNGRRTTSSSK